MLFDNALQYCELATSNETEKASYSATVRVCWAFSGVVGDVGVYGVVCTLIDVGKDVKCKVVRFRGKSYFKSVYDCRL